MTKQDKREKLGRKATAEDERPPTQPTRESSSFSNEPAATSGSVPPDDGLGDHAELYDTIRTSNGVAPRPRDSFLVAAQWVVIEENHHDEETTVGMKSFSVAGNGLVGSLPLELGQWHSLQLFEVNMNSLTGTMPADFGALTESTCLDVSFNSFTRSLPTELGQLMPMHYI